MNADRDQDHREPPPQDPPATPAVSTPGMGPEAAPEPHAGTAAGNGGSDPQIDRLLHLLEGEIRRSGRSRREIERSLGLGTGYLTHLFASRMELKIRHITMLARELGFDAPALFHQAFLDIPLEANPPAVVRRSGGLTSEDVRRLIREELARETG